ncbi:DinB family protein [Ornithinimicrobium tianjinense]|nr:DinB family protein [Ornithinimicrobium tianjinense]
MGTAPETPDLDIVSRLHEQLDWHWHAAARPRLDGLTDEEYLWEPTPGAWSLRRAGESSPGSATLRLGQGDWQADYASAEPVPPPVTTIAWRLAHVIVGVLGQRAHSHFGGPPASYGTWAYAGTAQEALAQLDSAYAAWSAGVRGLTPQTLLHPVGPAESPWAESPMIDLVLHINRECIHHLAEVALLRDLWAHRGG